MAFLMYLLALINSLSDIGLTPFILLSGRLLLLQRFLKLCKKPIVDSNDTGSCKVSYNIVRRVYKKHTVGHMDFRIDALLLPEDMIWPSFLASKQRGSGFKNIYLQRQTAVDINRRKISLDILRKRGKVVWAGSPGIGKSCDINFILMELLRHLGKEGWPGEVLFRVEDYLYTLYTLTWVDFLWTMKIQIPF